MFEKLPQGQSEVPKKKKRSLRKIAMVAGSLALAGGMESCDKDEPEKIIMQVNKNEKLFLDSSEEFTFEYLEVQLDPNKPKQNLRLQLAKYQEKLKGEKIKERARFDFIKKINQGIKRMWEKRMGSYTQQLKYFERPLENLTYRRHLNKLVERECKKAPHVDPELVYGVMAVESRLDQRKSSGIAWGVGMVTPEIAVDGGVIDRDDLHDCWKEKRPYVRNGKTVRLLTNMEKKNPKKRRVLIRRLQREIDLNVQVTVAGLERLIKKYNGDVGIALAAYNVGIVDIEDRLLKFYNDWQSREYEKDQRMRRGKRKGVLKPKAMTRAKARKIWPQLLREANITFFDLLSQKDSNYGVQEYVFNVLALQGVAQEIMTSRDVNLKPQPLVDPQTAKMWRLEKEKKKRITKK